MRGWDGVGIDIPSPNPGRAVSFHPFQLAVAVGEEQAGAVGCE